MPWKVTSPKAPSILAANVRFARSLRRLFDRHTWAGARQLPTSAINRDLLSSKELSLRPVCGEWEVNSARPDYRIGVSAASFRRQLDMDFPRLRGLCLDRPEMNAVPKFDPANHLRELAARVIAFHHLAAGITREAEDAGMGDVRQSDCASERQSVKHGAGLRELLVHKG